MIFETRIAFEADDTETANEIADLLTVQAHPGHKLLPLGVREITEETPGLEAEAARRHFGGSDV